MKRFVLALALYCSACVPVSTPVVTPPVPPTPPPVVAPATTQSVQGTVRNAVTGQGISCFNVTITPDNGAPIQCLSDPSNSRFQCTVPVDVQHGDLDMSAEGYEPFHAHIDVVPNLPDALTVMQPLPPPVPPAPSRQQALNIHSHDMQGIICHTDQYGDLHWFGAALPWLNPSDRQKIYACKHALGDTHEIIGLPSGPPLYNECCNDYSPDRFGPLDWTAGETAVDGRLADLVVEVRNAGFIPIVFPDERQEHSLKQTLLVLDALQHSKYGDIRNQVGLYMTGWDSVFYGWDPDTLITDWAVAVRQQCPGCFLGLEFNTGHIPQEAFVDMSGFDAEFIEFDNSVHTWNNWQIVSRMIGENRYHIPADDDSPHPVPNAGGPAFEMRTPRGLIQTVCFEWKTYTFVRGRDQLAQIADDRAYLIAEGCPAVD